MENREKIGIMFCGGCNCYFSREDFYNEIIDKLGSDYSFSLCKAEESHQYNLLVVINGCQSECLIGDSYDCPVLLINNKNYTEGTALITKTIESMKRAKGN